MVPVCAQAQVRVNSSALQQLQGLPAPTPAPAESGATIAPVAKPHMSYRHKEKPAPSRPAPVIPRPAKPAAAPSVKPVTVPPPTAHTTPATPLVAHVEFAPGSAVVSPDALKALEPFCHAGTNNVPLITRAPGATENLANTMQLAMQRALALRTALIACGVPAQTIIPYAVGTVAGADNNQALIGVSPSP